MTETIQVLAPVALIGFFAFCLFLLWFYKSWQDFVIDQTRQRLFELRDQWFDEFMDDPRALQSEPVRSVRELLNGHIRFAHRLTVPTFIWFIAFADHKKVAASYQAVQRVIDALPQDRKARAQSLLNNAARTSAFGAYRRSMLAMIVTPIAVVLLLAVAVVTATLALTKVRKRVEELQRQELAFTAANEPGVSRMLMDGAVPC